VVVNLQQLSEQEKASRQYAANFFYEEKGMEGIFMSDIKILDSVVGKKGVVLDAAMGPGRHVKYFSERGFSVWGNDFNKHMITAAKKYVGKRKATYSNDDMRNLSSIKSNFFDYVVCMGASLGSIYRKKERQKAVNELARVAKKEGKVLIHVHNLFELTELSCFVEVLAAVKNRILSPEKFELGDVVYSHGNAFKQAYMHWFTPNELRSMMGNAGLFVEKEFYLKGPNQDKIFSGDAFLKYLLAGGFVFVGRKV
jgi:ubiquinone/menaquinone biosynthesis C-methylase UbiE